MSTIVITLGGTDITNHVLFSTVNFESQLAAVPGTFSFIVRDENREFDFHTGAVVTLTIDSQLYFGGFATRVTQQFALPYDKTADMAEMHTRQWLIEGVDYNILFDKRFVYNVASPISKIPDFSTSLTDAEVINLLMDSYLDLTGDSIGRAIEAVGDPTPSDTVDSGAFAWGEAWRKQMEDIAQFTGAIWYLSPAKTLIYRSLESETVSWYFSDRPNRTTTFGFREFSYTTDATNLANDALVWGGAPLNTSGGQISYARSTADSANLAANGRWQYAETHFGEVGYYDNVDCQVRTDVVVFGDPGAGGFGMDPNRGLQNPQRQLRISWHSGTTPTPLYPGQIVTTFLYTYGTQSGGTITPQVITLPLRQVRISFPTPTVARFDGFFGIQTSDPWSLWKYLKGLKIQVMTQPVATVSTSDGSDPSVIGGTIVQAAPIEAPNGVRTVFHTTYPYIPLTTEITVNGLLQRPGFEYTESDPASGEFTFDFTPASDDQIWTRFTAAGG